MVSEGHAHSAKYTNRIKSLFRFKYFHSLDLLAYPIFLFQTLRGMQ